MRRRRSGATSLSRSLRCPSTGIQDTFQAKRTMDCEENCREPQPCNQLGATKSGNRPSAQVVTSHSASVQLVCALAEMESSEPTEQELTDVEQVFLATTNQAHIH